MLCFTPKVPPGGLSITEMEYAAGPGVNVLANGGYARDAIEYAGEDLDRIWAGVYAVGDGVSCFLANGVRGRME